MYTITFQETLNFSSAPQLTHNPNSVLNQICGGSQGSNQVYFPLKKSDPN